MMKKLIALFFAAAAALTALMAGEPLRTATAISDHMVIQQNTQTPVWGWGQPGAKVKVTPSWGREIYTATVAADSSWRVQVKTPAAGGPYTLTVVSGKEKLTVSDILSGEVWIFSGQSNMDMPLRGFDVQVVEGTREELMASGRYADKVRMFRSKGPKAFQPQKDIPGTAWEKAAGLSAARLSAIAWFFSTRLSDILGVPVGVIDNSWGGSKIEPYMTEEAVRQALEGKIPEARFRHILGRQEEKGKAPVQIATTWNGRVLPMAGYAARGFIWYQGESNRKDRYYDLLLAAMAQLWRTAWGDVENKMPFMFTTIAPYKYGDSSKTVRPFFVENQLHALELIPNSYAAITESLGNETCIHPAQKREVAGQFLVYALEKIYRFPMGMGVGYPEPEKFEFKDSVATVTFKNTANGLGQVGRREVKGFELAGEDRVFHPAQAAIDKKKHHVITVTSPEVPAPVAVRYNFRNYGGGDLTNSFGVPVPCFRSDDWPEE